MTRLLDLRKVIGGIFITFLLILNFLLIRPSLVIDWTGDGTSLTSLQLFVGFFILLAFVLYHVFYPSNSETTKLSLTASFTVAWLGLVLFYPFKTDTNGGGAAGFFALVGGLAVCVLWVYWFSDDIVPASRGE